MCVFFVPRESKWERLVSGLPRAHLSLSHARKRRALGPRLVLVLKTSACADNRITITKKHRNQSVVPLDVELERRTMTTISEISARGNLNTKLCVRYQSATDQSADILFLHGMEEEKYRPLDHMTQIPFIPNLQLKTISTTCIRCFWSGCFHKTTLMCS